jgi:hypothetical protein
MDSERIREQFLKERNAALETGDLDVVLAFARKWHHPQADISTRKVAEMAMHKAITACEDLTMARRMESKRWLLARGYKSYDDGDV